MTEEQTPASIKEKTKSKSKIKFKIIQPKKEISLTQESDITEYINQLTPIEQIVLKIAEEQLESSFDIKKSIGFVEWKTQTNK
jgi:hypothetical protein